MESAYLRGSCHPYHFSVEKSWILFEAIEKAEVSIRLEEADDPVYDIDREEHQSRESNTLNREPLRR